MEVYEEDLYSLPRTPYFSVWSILENYGWYILIGVVAFAYIYGKFLQPIIYDIRRKQEDEEYSAKYHKNPDLLLSRVEAQEKRSRLLQEKYEKDAEAHKKKIEEKEAKKREELAQKLEGKGQRLGSAADGNNSNTKSLRTDHNPLMGHGSSSNYRPPRRSACSRGGCG